MSPEERFLKHHEFLHKVYLHQHLKGNTMTPTPPSPSLQFDRPETREEYKAGLQFCAYAWGLTVFVENDDFHGEKYCTFMLTIEEAKTLREFLNRNLER